MLRQRKTYAAEVVWDVGADALVTRKVATEFLARAEGGRALLDGSIPVADTSIPGGPYYRAGDVRDWLTDYVINGVTFRPPKQDDGMICEGQLSFVL